MSKIYYLNGKVRKRVVFPFKKMKFSTPLNYIEPGNPSVLNLDKNLRTISAREISIVIINGENYCAWCAKNKVIGKKKYCSSNCQTSCYSFLTPQNLKGMYLFNQNYLCSNCEYDYRPIFIQALNELKWIADIPGRLNKEIKDQIFTFNLDTSYPSDFFVSKVQNILSKKNKKKLINIDHTKALALGGCARGFQNLQAICYECHQKKTKIDMQRIRLKKQTIK